MPLQIQIIGTGPGRGLFEISRSVPSDDGLELAIQRNADDRYLGPGLVWQTTIHWHWCPVVDGDALRVRLAAGPEIVDGILGSAVNALLVEIRGDNRGDSGILRIRGLAGSHAGAERLRKAPGQAPAGPALYAEERSGPVATSPPHRTWIWATLIIAGLAIAAGIAWHRGLFDSRPAGGRIETAGAPPSAGDKPPFGTMAAIPANSEPMAPAPVETDQPGEAFIVTTGDRSPTLAGREMVQEYLKERPSAQDLFTRAEGREQAGDCEAAILLYERAASAEPMTAARVAARYDPAGFEGSDCIQSPSRESALVWYEDAAKAGDVRAQRRLGQLLVEQTRSGVNHEQGRDWLRRAAADGDEQAQRILDDLDKQSRTSSDR